MTGVELVDAIRARRLHTPVILASGYAELPEGVDERLQRLAKPYTQADLARALRRVCPAE